MTAAELIAKLREKVDSQLVDSTSPGRKYWEAASDALRVFEARADALVECSSTDFIQHLIFWRRDEDLDLQLAAFQIMDADALIAAMDAGSTALSNYTKNIKKLQGILMEIARELGGIGLKLILAILQV